MRLHDIAFHAAIFFIIGVFIASVAGGFSGKWFVVLFTTLAASSFFFIRGKKALALMSAVVLAGAAYYFFFDYSQKATAIPVGKPIMFEAVVRKAEATERGQELKVGEVRMYMPAFPQFEYGDKLSVEGTILKPEKNLENYFLKEGITGIMRYPKITVLEKNRGNAVMSALLKLRSAVLRTFSEVLPHDEALFLSGLTLGAKSAFTKEYREMFSRNGTSHLVALSGYNIMVIAGGLAYVLWGWFSRRVTFILTSLAIFLFVLTTGAEASIVRAALMGGILLLADQTNRVYSFRNAISIVAALMLLENPKILVYDIGFQLSFAALLGIVYLRPLIRHVFKMKNDDGIFGWRKNLTTTAAAQIAVLPILLAEFGSLSLSGLLSNVLILQLIPATMFLGFAVAVFGFFSHYLALGAGYLAHLLLSLELGTIKFFSGFGYAENVSGFGWGLAAMYYAALAALVYNYSEKVTDLDEETK